MYTLELGGFELDLPDSVAVEADVASPNPLFSNMRVGTIWRLDLGRFVMTAALDPVRGLHDLSRRAFDEDLPSEPIAANGIPGIKVGDYDGARTEIDWWFTLNGLTLAVSLRSASGGQVMPTVEERAQHAGIVGSVRRVSRED